MKALNIIFLTVALAATSGCAITAMERVGKNQVLIARSDGLLFGLLRKVMICEVTPKGVKNCTEDEQP